MAGISSLGKKRDHIGLLERARGFERQQFRIARPNADTDQLSRLRCAR
jgi:hypothetical protein